MRCFVPQHDKYDNKSYHLLISIKENPEYKDKAIDYISNKWPVSRNISGL
ncbi:hypothetical protein ACFO6W_00890 [Dysgonomonas termitidis]|uniref:Transposase IS200-like domain-containing protein n=1 Tax=Dysgonomonas termitidis TaxID=1516126 RepID=A0ABV9KRN9_9BACT